MICINIGGGGNGGTGTTNSGVGNISGGAGGGSGTFSTYLYDVSLLGRALTVYYPGDSTIILYQGTGTGAVANNTALAVGVVGGNGGNGSSGTSTAGTAPSTANIIGLMRMTVGLQWAGNGQAGRTGLAASAGTAVDLTTGSICFGGPSAGGVQDFSAFGGAGSNQSNTLVYENAFAAGAANSPGLSTGTKIPNGTFPFVAIPGSSAGANNDGTGDLSGLSNQPGAGGAGGSSSTLSSFNSGSAGGPPLLIIQFI